MPAGRLATLLGNPGTPLAPHRDSNPHPSSRPAPRSPAHRTRDGVDGGEQAGHGEGEELRRPGDRRLVRRRPGRQDLPAPLLHARRSRSFRRTSSTTRTRRKRSAARSRSRSRASPTRAAATPRRARPTTTETTTTEPSTNTTKTTTDDSTTETTPDDRRSTPTRPRRSCLRRTPPGRPRCRCRCSSSGALRCCSSQPARPATCAAG